MALIPPISPAIPTPIQGQPVGFAAAKAESDTKRVTGAAQGANTGQSRSSTLDDGDARERSERSGQFSNSGTTGTRGGDSGMLSESYQLKSDGSREGRQDRAVERAQRSTSQARPESVRQAEETRTPREQAFTERMADVKAPENRVSALRSEVAPVSDAAKTERFVERLGEVRKASPEIPAAATEIQKTEAPEPVAQPTQTPYTSNAEKNVSKTADTAEQPVSTGRYDKYV